jgi:hypothetical protein
MRLQENLGFPLTGGNGRAIQSVTRQSGYQIHRTTNEMKHIAIIAMGFALVMPLHAEENAAKDNAKKKPNPEKVFKKKDKDGDGFLSKDEFTAGAKDAAKAETAFGKKDKDGDGKLSKKEFAGGGKAKKKK